VTVQCSCDWSYVWVWDGEGSATAQATPANHNQLTTSITFRSPDYGHRLTSLPPTIAACHTAINFQPMKFNGKNIGGDVIQLFDGTVQSKIEDAINGKACDALGDLVPVRHPSLLSRVFVFVRVLVESFSLSLVFLARTSWRRCSLR
jgi:hypothetical protein